MSSEDFSNVLKKMIMDDLGERVRILIDRGSKELEDRKNMSDNARDTQFQGFAKTLTDELIKYLTSRGGLTLDEIEQEWNKIIARRAYDFAVHVVAYLDEDVMQRMGKGYILSEIIENDIPDMTELPKERKGPTLEYLDKMIDRVQSDYESSPWRRKDES